jgi:hypothetical protein
MLAMMDDAKLRELREEIRRKIEAACNATNAKTNAVHRKYIALRNEVYKRYRDDLSRLKRELHAELDEIDRQFYSVQDSVNYELTLLEDQKMRDTHLRYEARILERLKEES